MYPSDSLASKDYTFLDDVKVNSEVEQYLIALSDVASELDLDELTFARYFNPS